MIKNIKFSNFYKDDCYILNWIRVSKSVYNRGNDKYFKPYLWINMIIKYISFFLDEFIK